MADHAALIAERLEQLLAETDASTDARTFRGKQYDLGLGWVHFPEGYGGVGAPPKLQRVVEEGIADAGRKAHDAGRTFFGLTMAGPTIVTHGSEEAKQRLLRPMFTGEDAWCQLFSEPGAGSDLAGLSCKAVRDGDEWLVTGQKVWNTLAHIADRGMLVARTDPQQPKHRGLTYFALDMHAPGVEVRPLRQITGEAEFNEVYMTEVRVPDADRIGDVGVGWGVAMTTLANERTTIGGGGSGARRQTGPVSYQWGKGAMAEALRIWKEEAPDPSPAMKDRLMQMMVQSEVLYLTNVRAGQLRQAGNPGPEGSIAKLMFSEVNKRLYELCVDLLGPRATIGVDYSMRRADAGGLVGAPGNSRKMFLRSRANSIEGGSSEVQRNILGERVLGLPGDVRVDKDRPWAEVPRS